MAQRGRKDPKVNYDVEKQVEPSRRMGAGDYANLPDRPVITMYPRSKNYRDAFQNDTDSGVFDISGISENECQY
jgi:hypothetical protein